MPFRAAYVQASILLSRCHVPPATRAGDMLLSLCHADGTNREDCFNLNQIRKPLLQAGK